MSDFTPFLQSTYPLALLQERSRIVEQLARYVTATWRDIYTGTEVTKASEFRASVKSAMFDVFSQLYDIPKKLRPSMRNPGDTHALVIDAFQTAMNISDEESICTPHFSNDALVKAFSKHFSTTVINANAEAKPSVAGALQMACDSYRQAVTRRVALLALFSLVRTNEYAGSPNLAWSDDLFNHLFERKGYFTRNMLMFGGMLGGEALAKTIKLVARDCCHKEDAEGIQFSIMHFLTGDGRHPGMYYTVPHDEFAADIKAKYEAL